MDFLNFVLNTSPSVVEVECFRISHVAFTQTYNIVRNVVGGFTAQGVTYDYYPVSVEPLGTKEDLDQSMSIVFGDLGEIVPREIDAIRSADAFDKYPSLVYLTYSSSDTGGTPSPMFGPVELEIRKFSMTKEGCAFIATAPQVNNTKVGELYLITRFKMLDGLL